MADRLLNPLPTDPIDDLIDCMPKETPTIEEDATKLVIDLDKVLSSELSTPTAGGEQKNSIEKTETLTKNESKQKETPKPKNSNEIDIESLLSQFK